MFVMVQCFVITQSFRDAPNSLQVFLYYDEFTINPIYHVSTKLKIGKCIWGLGKVLFMSILYYTCKLNCKSIEIAIKYTFIMIFLFI